MGPSVSSLMNRPFDYLTRFLKDQAKRILRGILQGIRFLHAHGIVHGDLYLGSFLCFTPDIESISSDGLRQNESSPGVSFIPRQDGKVNKWAPQYLVKAKPPSRAEIQCSTVGLVSEILVEFSRPYHIRWTYIILNFANLDFLLM